MSTLLSDAQLDAAALLAAVSAPDRGGVALFVGTVRDHHDGRAVLRLEYSAYADMAEAEARRITQEAEERWPVALAMRHRVGALEVGDLAVVIAAGSAHRDAALAACSWAIEDVKRRVPIWKHEHYADGTSGWVEPREAARA
jgi:molybdopterin synthase catalytic subunit